MIGEGTMSNPAQQHRPPARPRDEVVQLLRDSGLVDEDWYRRIYRDVADGGLDPVEHYVDHGAPEGRNPNSHFDTQWYVATYPDVHEAGVNPLLHYLIDGADEGRRTSRSFDTAQYLSDNPDVVRAGINPLLHYLRIGLREGRLGRRYAFGVGRRG